MTKIKHFHIIFCKLFPSNIFIALACYIFQEINDLQMTQAYLIFHSDRRKPTVSFSILILILQSIFKFTYQTNGITNRIVSV